MIVAIAYHNGDLPLMRRWANRVKQLGPYMNHEIILSPVRGVTTDGILLPLENCFRKVHIVPANHSEQGWPVSCNRAFQNIAWHSTLVTRQSFLFMEPDAIPLCEGWIDQIEAEYRQCQRPFMGDFVDLSSADIPGGIDHMSGIAVYDWNLSQTASRVFNCVSNIKFADGHTKEEEYAWDIFAASDIVPKMHRTTLIQHDWRGTSDRSHEWRKNNVEPSFVRPGAVIYHPDKKGVLLNDGLAGPSSSVQGDPATGGDAITTSSFNHDEPAPIDEKTTEIQQKAPLAGTKEAQLGAIDNAINVLAFHHNLGGWNRKHVKESLVKAGFAKASKVKRVGKKVRPSLVNA